MKLSTKGRYAVIALADLALSQKNAPVALNVIADRQNISGAYLEQLFVKLRRAGLIRSVRGPNGGYTLAKTADLIKLTDILAAVDEDIDVTTFGSNFSGPISGTKAQSLSNRLWESLSAQVYVFMHQICLADVTDNKLAPCPAVPHLLRVVDE